jgi:hypothetical protein
MSKFYTGQRVFVTNSPSLQGVVTGVDISIGIPVAIAGHAFKTSTRDLKIAEENKGVDVLFDQHKFSSLRHENDLSLVL